MAHLVLIPSPFLGSAVWQPVAERLREEGVLVTVVGFPSAVSSPGDVLARLEDVVPDEDGLVLVPHSNAGLYTAAIAARRRVHGIVFVDALLPGSGAHTQIADPGLASSVAALADEDGVLPPWTHWWDDVEELFPDPWTRARVEADQPRLPSAYLRGAVPTPPGWERARPCYLGFGDSYADEIALAAGRGWPVRVLEGRHLHMLVDPAGVAAAVVELIGPERNTGAAEPVAPA